MEDSNDRDRISLTTSWLKLWKIEQYVSIRPSLRPPITTLRMCSYLVLKQAISVRSLRVHTRQILGNCFTRSVPCWRNLLSVHDMFRVAHTRLASDVGELGGLHKAKYELNLQKRIWCCTVVIAPDKQYHDVTIIKCTVYYYNNFWIKSTLYFYSVATLFCCTVLFIPSLTNPVAWWCSYSTALGSISKSSYLQLSYTAPTWK
jgi:hypothetical protein